MANLLRGLAPRHDIHWISLVTPAEADSPPPIPGLAAPPTLVAARHNATWKSKAGEAFRPRMWRRTASRVAGLLKGVPIEVARMRFPAMETEIRKLLGSFRFDVVQLEYTALAQYAAAVRDCSPRTRVVLDELEISYVAEERRVAADGSGAARGLRRAQRMRRFEEGAWRRCDAVVTMSDVESRLVEEAAGPEKAFTVPNGVDLDYFKFSGGESRDPAAAPPRLLFVGNLKHRPNSRGLAYFFDEVWPGLKRDFPDLALDVVGEGAGLELLSHRGESVCFHGYVPDVRPYLSSCTLMAVPILSGAGTRLKVLEAFACGAPVVSTRLGCEGIEVSGGGEVLPADSPREFRDAVAALLKNPERRAEMARRARGLVERKYGWETICRDLERAWAPENG